MNADTEHFLNNMTRLDSATRKQFENSGKVYLTGSREDLKVPMREIRLTDTITEKGNETNAPVRVYDSSGPYSDPNAKIDLRDRVGRNSQQTGLRSVGIPSYWTVSALITEGSDSRMYRRRTCVLNTCAGRGGPCPGRTSRSCIMLERE